MIAVVIEKSPIHVSHPTLRARAENDLCRRSRTFVAVVNQTEAGILSYEDWSDQASGFIYEVYVLQESRAQGVATLLLKFAEQYARELKCKNIRLKPYALDKTTDQTRLVTWYARLGFGPSSEGSDLLEKRLTASVRPLK